MYKDKELIDYLPNYQDMRQLKIIDELVHMLQKKDRELFGKDTTIRNCRAVIRKINELQ